MFREKIFFSSYELLSTILLAAMSEKLIVTFASEASPTDTRTTVIRVKTVRFGADGPSYAFPPSLQGTELHPELMATSAGRLVRKALDARGKYRTVTISVPTDTFFLYADEDRNPVFKEVLLEEWLPPRSPIYTSDGSTSGAPESVAPLPRIEPPKPRSLSSISKDMVLEKFGVKRKNASSWIDIFESECARMDLCEGRYWEALRLFLEGRALDWFDSCRQTLNKEDWQSWRTSFLHAFADKGWSAVRFALTYRFTSGSLADYAIAKQNMLINVHKLIDEDWKIFQIIVGLPISVQEKLDRAEITSVSTLLRKLNALDRPTSTRSLPSKSPSADSNSAFASLRSRLCAYCLRKGHERTHSESNCRTKEWDITNGRFHASASKDFKDTPRRAPDTVPKYEKPAVHNMDLIDFLHEVDEKSKNE